MSLKKSLIIKDKSGQASLEYFLIFLAIATLTIVSFSTFLPRVRNAMQGSGGLCIKAWGQLTR